MSTIHQISIKEIIKESWTKTKANYWFIFVFLAIGIGLTILTSKYFIPYMIVAFAFNIMVISLSIAVARGHKATTSYLTSPFQTYKITLNYVLSSILTMLAILVGLILLIIPGLYLSVKLSMVKYIAVDKENLRVMEILKESMKITDGNFWKIVLFGLTLIGINILGLIPLFLGLIITVPLSMTATALFYDKLLHIHHTKHSQIHTA